MAKRGWVTNATPELCGRLLAHIPDGDNEDMIRGWGMSSASAVMLSYQLYKPSYMIMADDNPVGIFGCADDGQIWMMRGEGLEDVAVQFIRKSRPYFYKWLNEYGHIFAQFWGENRKLLRFMVWSGFTATELDDGYVRCDKWAQPQV